tara:strand:- start:75 stop:683 length:609 start_codon:yes stop_codon:yes gene_type:complete
MRFVLSVLLLFGLTGCGVLSPVKVRPISHYTISGLGLSHDASPAISGSGKSTQTLLLQTMMSSPGYQSSDMVYVAKPYQLESFAYHQWVAPPSQLILPVLMRALQDRGYYHAVLMAPSSGVSDRVLATRLLYLNENVTNPKQPWVSCAIDVALLDASNDKIIREKVFTEKMKTASDAYSYATNLNKIMAKMTIQIVDFVSHA